MVFSSSEDDLTTSKDYITTNDVVSGGTAMRNTAKYSRALETARTVLEAAELRKVKGENATLYDALEQRGYFWDAENAAWLDFQKSTSLFESDSGLPTGTFRLRLMAHPGDMDRLLDVVGAALAAQNCEISEVSSRYPNRRGPGVRVYLSCQLPPSRDYPT